MTGKERIGRLLQRQPADRVGLFEVFWTETAQRWAAEGYLPSPESVEDHFNLDLRRCRALDLVANLDVGDAVSTETDTTRLGFVGVQTSSETRSGTQNLDVAAPRQSAANLLRPSLRRSAETPLREDGFVGGRVTVRRREVLIEETETTRLVRDGNGAVLRWLKGSSGAPEHVDFLVKDRRGWEEHIRPHLVNAADHQRRIDFDFYRGMRAYCAQHHLFLTCGVVGPFDLMTPLCGHEHLLVGMALDPDWARDMADLYSRLTIELLEILFNREGLPDGLWVWEDLAFKQRPFVSPAMYRELLLPAHRRLFQWARARKLPVILHSDGFVEPLLPDLIEAGVDCLQPLDVKAGMDLLRVKKQFGDHLALIGGMDGRVLETNNLDAVRAELEQKLPGAMAGGGYILQTDHSVSSRVHYATYRHFVETGLALGIWKGGGP